MADQKKQDSHADAGDRSSSSNQGSNQGMNPAGDPGRTPGSAEGDRQTVEDNLRNKTGE
jgi:hypothetical protein